VAVSVYFLVQLVNTMYHLNGKGQAATSGKMNLSQLYDYWKDHHATPNLEITTIAYNDNLFTRISQALGKKRINQIESRHIQTFLKNMAAPRISKIKGNAYPLTR
jgi:hypothetical protein